MPIMHKIEFTLVQFYRVGDEFPVFNNEDEDWFILSPCPRDLMKRHGYQFEISIGK